MNSINAMKKKILLSLQVMFGLIWLSDLSPTDAYFSIYVLIAFFSVFLMFKVPNRIDISFKSRFPSIFLSVMFSVAVLLANYPLYTTIGDPALISRSTSLLMNLIDGVFGFIGGICVSYPIFQFFFSHFPMTSNKTDILKWEKFLPVLMFVSIAGLHLMHLFLVEYPGNVTEDPFSQIEEMVLGQYSNFNTYWHTRLLQAVLTLGYAIFSDLNASIALFCTLQSVIMAFAFTYCLLTMYRAGAPGWFVVLSWAAYALLPYHMALSITIWKDVLFSGAGLLIVSSMLRILNNFSCKKWFDYVVLILGSILFFVSRTNGWLIYLVTVLIFAFFVHKNKCLLAVVSVLAIFGWFLLNPALSMLHVDGGDKVESLSIPVQQVSRVIAAGKELTPEETELLECVVDLEEVPELYEEWISDPMKVALRSKNYEYFLTHLDEYRDLWIRLGIRYPWEYVKAWVEQTKGYWNLGYSYGQYSETITDNPYGAEKIGGNNLIAALFRLYFGFSRHLIFFEPLHSIGLHIWIVMLCFLLNVIRKRPQFIVSVPYLLLVIGLWFGTPVYACFRYIYPLFAAFPLILSTALWKPAEE